MNADSKAPMRAIANVNEDSSNQVQEIRSMINQLSRMKEEIVLQ